MATASRFGGISLDSPTQAQSRFGGLPVDEEEETPETRRAASAPFRAAEDAQLQAGIEELQGSPLAATLEPLATIASAAIAEPLAGFAGIAQSINPFAEEGASAEAVAATREALTFQPRTPEGQASLASVGETLAPVGEFIESVEKGAGDIAFKATGSPLIAAAATALPEAVLSLIPLSKLRAARTATQTKIIEKIAESPADKSLVKFVQTGANKIAKDKLALETIKQGFDEGVIATVKGADKATREPMREMVSIMKRGRENALFAARNRPTDVPGKSMGDRVAHIVKINKQSGRDVERAAQALKGQPLDFGEAADAFIQGLGDMGITLRQNAKGVVRPVFKGSDIEGVTGAENVVRKLVKRMSDTRTPDAFDVHRMKKFIDEIVTFGKSVEGLGGKAERIMKKLRRDLDRALDSNFPEYNRANTVFAQTINAIDSLQDVAGKKMDLLGPNAAKAVGTLLRRMMSNAQSRVNLVDAVDEIERVAKNTGGKFDDDLLTQVLFADELDSMFGPVAKTSLAGETAKAVRRGVGAAASPEAGLLSAGADAAATIAERVRGINKDNALKSIDELLARETFE